LFVCLLNALAIPTPASPGEAFKNKTKNTASEVFA